MNQQAAPDYFELADYTGVLRRRWKSIAAVGLIGLVLAGAYVVIAPKTYTSTVLIQVSPLTDNANAVGGRTGGPVNMDNEAQVVRSAAVAALVKKNLRSPLSITAIQQSIHVSVPPNTTFLQISCAAGSAIGAQKCATVVGSQYLNYRRVSNMQLIGSGIKALQVREKKLSSRITTLKALLYVTRRKKGVTPNNQTLESLALQLASDKSAQAALRSHINQALPLQVSLADPTGTIVGQVVSPATFPAAPSSPRKLLYVPSGLMLGLVVGIGLAFLNERGDKRVHSVRDVERYSGQPTLLSLAGKRHGSGSGVESPRTAPGRAYNELAQVIATALGDSGHVIAVAATSPGASATAVSANLAAALARTTDRTVLICGDVHGTRAPELLGASRGRGLSEVLTGSASATEVLTGVPDVPGLAVIPPGLDVARAAALMRDAPMKRAVGDLIDQARYVVIEVQSVGENADTFGLAHFADASIVAVEVGRSRPDDISECAKRLERLGTPVLGTAVVPPVPIPSAARKGRRAEPARSAAPAAPAVLAEPAQDKPFVGSIKRYEMQPGQPAGPDQRPQFIAAPFASGMKETKPAPRMGAGERDGYPNPADPATGD
jgi:capsular polysaccharide biosynthesis protein